MKPGRATRPFASSTRLPDKRFRGDAHDLAMGDADVADSVDSRFRIHHAPALKNGVVSLRARRGGKKQGAKKIVYA